MEYGIPFAYERYGRIYVEADSVEEAKEKAEEVLGRMSLSEMEEITEYLPDSEEIDYDGIVLQEVLNTEELREELDEDLRGMCAAGEITKKEWQEYLEDFDEWVKTAKVGDTYYAGEYSYTLEETGYEYE